MHSFQQKSLSFIEHLSKQLNEVVVSDMQTTTTILNKDKITENDMGCVLRTFQHMDFHLSITDVRRTALIESYAVLYNKFNSNADDSLTCARAYICNILLDYVIPEIVNPENGLLKDQFIEMLGLKKYTQKTAEEKEQITVHLVNAYLFYLLSRTEDDFGNKLENAKFLELMDLKQIYDKLNGKLEPLALTDLQQELVNFENLKALVAFKKFCKPDSNGYSQFAFANKLIFDAVDIQKDYYDFFKNSTHHKLMYQLKPETRDQILECLPYYHMLGRNYGLAADTLLTNVENTPDLKLSMPGA